MSNVLKMEWFRFRKSSYVYIILLALGLIFLFGTVLDSVKKEEPLGVVQQETENSIQLYTENYDASYTGQYADKYEMLTSSFSGNIMAMAILIFSCLFAGAYRKNRFEKNIVGCVGGYRRLIFSNAIICAGYCLICILATIIISLLGYSLLYPDFASVPLGNTPGFVKYLMLYYILLSSVAVTMSCFVQLVGNQILAIVIGLFYGSGIVYDIIDFAGNAFGLEGFSVQRYVLLGNLYHLSLHSQDSYAFALFIAVICGMAALAINIWVKDRRDIVT